MKKETFFLFGEQACREWHKAIDFEKIESWCRSNADNFDVFKFTEGETSPEDLLLEYEGWQDYAVIPEAVYLMLVKILPW